MLRRIAIRPWLRAHSTIPSTFDASIRYPAPNTFTESDVSVNKYTQRPVPLNVQLTHIDPLKLPITHGHLVGEVTVASTLGLKDVEFVANFLMRAAFYLGIPAKGPTPMPGKVKRWTVIRSPFVHAKSKENWERRTYRRSIKLYDANPEVVQILLAIAAKHSMAGVGVKAVTYTHETLEAISEMDVATKSDHENPMAINKVDLESQEGGAVAKAVMELLKDPRFSSKTEDIPSKVKEQLESDKYSI